MIVGNWALGTSSKLTCYISYSYSVGSNNTKEYPQKIPNIQGFEQAYTVFHLQIEKSAILKKKLLNMKTASYKAK